MDDDIKIFYNDEIKKYMCPICDSKYKSKYTFIKHLQNKKRCDFKKSVKDLLNYSKELNENTLNKNTLNENILNIIIEYKN